MNNQRKARYKAWHDEMKKKGFPASVYKKKAKPFPKPDKDVDLSMRTQSLMFDGPRSIHAKKS